MSATRACREYIPHHEDDKVNCATCAQWNRSTSKCIDEKGLLKRYDESIRFKIYDKMMRENKGVVLE